MLTEELESLVIIWLLTHGFYTYSSQKLIFFFLFVFCSIFLLTLVCLHSILKTQIWGCTYSCGMDAFYMLALLSRCLPAYLCTSLSLSLCLSHSLWEREKGGGGTFERGFFPIAPWSNGVDLERGRGRERKWDRSAPEQSDFESVASAQTFGKVFITFVSRPASLVDSTRDWFY